MRSELERQNLGGPIQQFLHRPLVLIVLFVLAVGTDRQFARLAEVVGHPEWAEDERYRTNPARVSHRAELESKLEESFRREPRDVWLARFRRAAIPAGPVRGPLEALQCDTARSLAAVLERYGVPFVASPIRFDGHEPRLDFPPALDEDGEGIRREFGLPG